MTTWSPTLTERTSEPTASTTPAPSWPSTDGAFHGMVPLITERSLWHTPAAANGHPHLGGPGISDLQLVGDLHVVTGVDDASHGILPLFVRLLDCELSVDHRCAY